ncbi:hypothetical protein [Streptomyces sp. NPDC020983]|uniref:hypothetical protein n=1 Tax=Streptomyces sp. NPDC020983 TaxID=3365106 RepID=UPI0037A5E1A7
MAGPFVLSRSSSRADVTSQFLKRKALRASPRGTRLGRSQALATYFLFLELRHKVEIHRMTGRVIERPIDEMNRQRRDRCPVARKSQDAAGRQLESSCVRQAGTLCSTGL